MSLNHITIMGRLTATPELRRTSNGVAVTSFCVACDRDFRSATGEKETDFIDVVCFDKRAEFVCKSFTKGRAAIVDGRLQIRSWTDKSGNKRKTAEIVANNIYFGDSKTEEMQTGNWAPAGADYHHTYNTTTASTADYEEIEDDMDDVPF